MSTAHTFFQSRQADRLMNPSCYPPQIVEFLRQEQRMLDSMKESIDLLIEVGCTDGRYLNWAVESGKRYIGIDIVLRHIHAGQRAIAERGLPTEAYQFLLGDAEEIAHLIGPNCLPADRTRSLVLFPFNIFGAIPDSGRVLTGLHLCHLPFAISSYQTTAYATACRYEYYKRCGCKDICLSHDEKGVSFRSAHGFQTVAYHPEYLQKLCNSYGISVKTMAWSKLNMVCATDAVFAHIQLESLLVTTQES